MIDFTALYSLADKPKYSTIDFASLVQTGLKACRPYFTVPDIGLDYESVALSVKEPSPKRIEMYLELYPTETLQVMTYLQDHLPAEIPASPLDPKPLPPSAIEQWRFLDRFKTVVDTDYAQELVKTASLSAAQVDYLFDVHPSFISSLQAAVLEFVVNNEDVLTPSQNRFISTILRVARANAETIQQFQQNFTAEGKEQSLRPSKTKTKSVDQMMTPAQRVAQQ